MSWFQKLHATYEACSQKIEYTNPPQADGDKENPALMPVSHTSQQAHIHVVLDGQGNFLQAELLPPKTQVIIPATEDSAGRTSGTAPHPLADKIHYCAKDYSGTKENQFSCFSELLNKWCASAHSHPKAQAVLAYLSRGTLVRDLLAKGILHGDPATGTLLTEAPEGLKDSIFSRLTPKKVDGVAVRAQGDALVVWSVVSGDLESRTWKDTSLQQAWMAFDAAQMEQRGLCMVQGEESTITVKHPRNIRRPGDGAKLISSNDNDGFTFRGRFAEGAEACTIGYEASHKAHNALRWLIARQGYRNGDQAVVAWAINGLAIPNPCEPLSALVAAEYADDEFAIDINAPEADLPTPTAPETQEHRDVGEAFSKRLRKAMRGYKTELKDTDGIAILALDAANPSGKGRLAVTFYREQMSEHYLRNLEQWQEDCAWVLPVKITEHDAKGTPKERRIFVPCAPTPDTIARVAYGRRIDDKLRKATVERLLPCIVDGTALPRDLVECCVRRACNRFGLEGWEWPEVLGTACAVYKGYYARHPQKEERRYTMALDEERSTRDYLYGRLLAVAEYVERTALDLASEKRPTNAERLMQRFADHPCATWKQIRLQLEPYLQRLKNNEKGAWLPTTAKRLMQEVSDKFSEADYISSQKLSGEFLLGYHCQMSAFYTKREKQPVTVTPAQEGA